MPYNYPNTKKAAVTWKKSTANTKCPMDIKDDATRLALHALTKRVDYLAGTLQELIEELDSPGMRSGLYSLLL